MKCSPNLALQQSFASAIVVPSLDSMRVRRASERSGERARQAEKLHERMRMQIEQQLGSQGKTPIPPKDTRNIVERHKA